MILLEDTRQQAQKHKAKHAYFDKVGVTVERTKLYCGDYTLPTNQSVCIDSKFGISELVSDICGKQHNRFRAECQRAKEAGIKLIILVEDDGGYVDRKETIYNKPVRCIDDLFSWKNPRLFIWRHGKQLYPDATKGQTLAKACKTMESRYDVSFVFCKKSEAGAKILELLGANNERMEEV